MNDHKREKLLSYSEVYGIRREDVRQAVGDVGVRRASLLFLRTYPRAVYLSGLRKQKSRAILTALVEGEHVSGNHRVTCTEELVFGFAYRGTLIYRWDAQRDEEQALDAGVFEGTASTRNQRREIARAISEFRDGLVEL
jgi:hypothetical protein